jgi:hypothetical protein
MTQQKTMIRDSRTPQKPLRLDQCWLPDSAEEKNVGGRIGEVLKRLSCKAPVGNMVQIRDLSAGNGLQAQAMKTSQPSA